jgi:hypothetical protein
VVAGEGTQSRHHDHREEIRLTRCGEGPRGDDHALAREGGQEAVEHGEGVEAEIDQLRAREVVRQLQDGIVHDRHPWPRPAMWRRASVVAAVT